MPTFGLYNPEQLEPVVADELTQLNAALQTAFQQLGRGTDVPFNAGDFTGNGSMTFVVTQNSVSTFSYALLGKAMLVDFVVTGTVGGTPNNTLMIKIPGGLKSKRSVLNPIFLNDGGVRTAGDASTSVAGAFINCVRRDAANFTAGTVVIAGQLRIEVI